ncbi:phospholipase D family protein [Moraxella bovis]|uniref:phospholipase D family protein n=1 Tax=Moraxella bovis TaxID=476 RepID=UPI0022267D6C|nr:phospholipase D family protein [Moraxella bovis]UYZ67593.1 phospholipase D family protein [Moraxella bovis]UYZ69953.1 phospholipase D family protein [Moraxella bovis]UYZ74128.1 phospholipase D family protein [Moraxella bovis]UZA13236.1 phospholipase D family protein [Moraxella bovis]UZA28424.1 phospholipase D family protein [Moraxella bovis]
MAKFLNTSGTTYHLEELIKKATDRLVLISPYLQFNERIKELLEDKNRLKIDIRIVYGKSELSPQEINWLKDLTFVRTSFCKNLHAKCYLNEHECIITSLNLYEFSQVNNNEMGVLINKNDDGQLYADTYDEVQRIIRISEEVRLSADTEKSTTYQEKPKTESHSKPKNYDKITTAKLAEKFGIDSNELTKLLAENGYIELKGKNTFLTDKGREVGGEVKKGQYGYFIVWSVDLEIFFDDEKTSFADKLKSLFKI